MKLAIRPILCYVTDRQSLPARAAGAGGVAPAPHLEALREAMARAAAAGVHLIQIREKDLGGAQLETVVREAVSAGGGAARVLVNDRLDVALAAGAGGVHLGEASLPVERVARWVREEVLREFLVGASCHSLESALRAESEGADYIFFGPIFETPSKRAYGPPQGLERLGEVCRRVRIPVLAIGGITLDNAAACLASGASGLAAIRLFQDAEDLAATVAALRACR